MAPKLAATESRKPAGGDERHQDRAEDERQQHEREPDDHGEVERQRVRQPLGDLDVGDGRTGEAELDVVAEQLTTVGLALPMRPSRWSQLVSRTPLPRRQAAQALDQLDGRLRGRPLGRHDLEGDRAPVLAGADRQHRDAVVDREHGPRDPDLLGDEVVLGDRCVVVGREQQRAVGPRAEARSPPARRRGTPWSPRAPTTRRAARVAWRAPGPPATTITRVTSAAAARGRRVTRPTHRCGQGADAGPADADEVVRRGRGTRAAPDQREQGGGQRQRHQHGHGDGEGGEQAHLEQGGDARHRQRGERDHDGGAGHDDRRAGGAGGQRDAGPDPVAVEARCRRPRGRPAGAGAG